VTIVLESVGSNGFVQINGRSSLSYPWQPIKLDIFMNIRKNAYPAGSYKAFICLIVLEKVLASMHGVFLPWFSEINNVTDICESIANSGLEHMLGVAIIPVCHPRYRVLNWRNQRHNEFLLKSHF
jgi:hypothetical protein